MTVGTEPSSNSPICLSVSSMIFKGKNQPKGL